MQNQHLKPRCQELCYLYSGTRKHWGSFGPRFGGPEGEGGGGGSEGQGAQAPRAPQPSDSLSMRRGQRQTGVLERIPY